MTKNLVVAFGLALAFGVSSARAQAPKAEEKEPAPAAKDTKTAPPAPPPAAPPAMPAAAKPGPETAALKPIVANASWTGVMKAGAMGPGSPEMATKGKQKCTSVMGGLWAMCDIEDGPAAPKSFVWKAHSLMGWDVEAKEYRASIFDNMGTSANLKGKMDGAKLVMESPEQMMMGQPMKIRLTWDTTDPKAVKFTSERSVKGGPWTVDAESTYKAGK